MDRKKFLKKSALGVVGIASVPIISTGAKESGTKDNLQNGKRPRCKITVIRREFYQDLASQYLANPNVGKCNKFHDGQEFILEQRDFFSMMNGEFCSEAWDAIS